MSVYFVVNGQGCFLEAIEAESLADAKAIAESMFCGFFEVKEA